jgi:hypothetical protein
MLLSTASCTGPCHIHCLVITCAAWYVITCAAWYVITCAAWYVILIYVIRGNEQVMISTGAASVGVDVQGRRQL